MTKEHSFYNKNFLLWMIFSGLLFSAVALTPQIDLWLERGTQWNGMFAINELDEPFYATYLQSLIDGKPRRNSPYTGAADNVNGKLQKESYLSIQFFASYPAAIIAEVFGFSASTMMILIGATVGFLSGFVLCLLCYLFSKDGFSAFVGTTVVLFGGTLASGFGSVVGFFTSENIGYNSFFFLRRLVPAVAFPILFLFFIIVWKLLTTISVNRWTKIQYAIGAVACFAFLVFNYFYFWTTAIAWFFGLITIWSFRRSEDLRKNKKYLLISAFGFLATLVLYSILLLNRATNVDLALELTLTHQPDFLRVPEVISFLTIAILLISKIKKLIDFREPKILFLLSFAITPLLVFNQQILTGHTLQAFHYQLFSVNYISLLSMFLIVFEILRKRIKSTDLNKSLIIILCISTYIGFLGVKSSITALREVSIWVDKLIPVAEKIKITDENSQSDTNISQPAVLSFDLVHGYYIDNVALPIFTSRPIIWTKFITMFPDMDAKENISRLYTYMYYQNLDSRWLENELKHKNTMLQTGIFGAERVPNPDNREVLPITDEEIQSACKQYEEFRRNFVIENAQNPVLSHVIVLSTAPNDFSALDRWYQRDAGELVGQFIVYRVKLLNH